MGEVLPTILPAISLRVSQVVRIETIFHTTNTTRSMMDLDFDDDDENC